MDDLDKMIRKVVAEKDGATFAQIREAVHARFPADQDVIRQKMMDMLKRQRLTIAAGKVRLR